MCLYIGNKVALIAKKDITVYKYVKQTTDSNEYITPYTKTILKLNEILKPIGKITYNQVGKKYNITKGAIHAYLSIPAHNKENIFLKAIIKKGTTYYVQDDFKEIAADELYITDEFVEGENTSPDLKDICAEYINTVSNNIMYRWFYKDFTNKDGIHIGDYALSDKTFASPLSKFDHTKAIGIVAYFNKDDKPVIIALQHKNLPWVIKDVRNDYKVCSEINNESNDFEGKKHTYDIANSNNYNPQTFKAIAYCTEYKTNGTEKGDWYLGATGELIEVAKNIGIINASIMYTGVGKPIDPLNYAWTSSQKTSDGKCCTWTCNFPDGVCLNFCNSKTTMYERYKYYVRPFYRPQTQPEEHSTKQQ